MEKVTVYSKERCQPCKMTYMKLDKEGVPYEVVMLEDNPEKLQELIDEGFMESPVVDTGHEKWSGFRPDLIGKYALEMSGVEKPE